MTAHDALYRPRADATFAQCTCGRWERLATTPEMAIESFKRHLGRVEPPAAAPAELQWTQSDRWLGA